MTLIEFTARGAAVTGLLHGDHDRLAAHKTRPAMIVCPGGGYDHLSPREGEAPAMAFFAAGYNVFILHYSLGEQAADCLPLQQLARTVAHIREQAAQWHIRPDCIAAMGFSAGGHLVSTLGVRWRELSEAARPDALVLCYPVITMGEFTHPGTRQLVTGGEEGRRDWFSNEKHITPDFPASFVWHTADDPSVPVENTLLLVSALKRVAVPFECHIFAHGTHGLSTCNQEVEAVNPECRPWLELARTWLNNRFAFTE